MLQSAVFDVFPLRNLTVGRYETVAEAEGNDGLIGVEVLSTQDYDVSQTFRCAVFALDIVARVDAVSKTMSLWKLRGGQELIHSVQPTCR